MVGGPIELFKISCCGTVHTTRSVVLEGEVLVRGEESHELWHLNDLNHTGSVDIEVSPGLGEVGVEVLGNIG